MNRLLLSLALFYASCVSAAVPQAQLDALVALYNSTNGDGWKNSSNWLVGDPCTNGWFGVYCLNESTIKILALYDNQLNGDLPAELGNLSDLQTLNMWGNQITGSTPAELSNLDNLEYMHLHKNQLTGSIPPELGSMTNLLTLNLYKNQLTGSIPAELSHMTSLGSLGLSDNQLTGSIPVELEKLSNLSSLSLEKNQLTGSIPTELGNMTDLGGLYLSDNQLSGSIPPELSHMTNLVGLHLSGNQLTGSIPAELGNLAGLFGLILSENQFSGNVPPELGVLANLRYLQLHKNQLTGSIPPELGNLTNLVSLQLHQNQLTGSIPTELGNLTNLQTLSLGYNQLTGSIPAALENLANLKNLGLLSNQLTGNIPTELGSLANLNTLHLSYNHLTGTIPAELGNLINLQVLGLRSNMLTGSIPLELGNLTKLQWLNLLWNGLFTSDDALDEFLDTHSGFDWSFTQTIPPSSVTVEGSTDHSIILSWPIIEYTNDSGRFRVWYSTGKGGPYIDGGATVDKKMTNLEVNGLLPETTYYFVIRTETDSHDNNQNMVISDPSEEVSAKPTAVLARTKWQSGTHREYVVVSFPGQPWEDALDDLNALLPGFHLATITSQDEQEFVNNMIAVLDLGYSQWWLGGLQVPLDEPDPAAGWTWVTGEAWEYTNWWDIEPNDGGGCLCENHLALENTKWNDEGSAIGLITGYIAESYDPLFIDSFED